MGEALRDDRAATFGVDFGTTNTVVVDPDGEIPGGETIPTLVVLDPNGSGDRGFVAAGLDAVTDLPRYQAEGYHVIRSIKTFLDEDRHWDCARKQGGSPYVWRPVDVVRRFLEYLVEVVDEVGDGHALRRAVFSLPNGTSAVRRRIFREAATDAGIEVIGFVSESTAALIANRNDLTQQEKVAVFDWGGGTLDVSVLDVHMPSVRELDTRGHNHAGDEIDRRLARYLYENRIAGEDEAKFTFDSLTPQQHEQLRQAAEDTKIMLCGGQPEVDVIFELVRSGGREVFTTVTREQFQGLCRPLLDEAVDLLERAIRQAGVAPEELGQVLLAGGSSNLLGLQEAIESRLGDDVLVQGPPALERLQIVAKGAVQTARAGVRHELADPVDAGIAGEGRIPLARPGDTAATDPVTAVLRIVEESRHAELPVFAGRGRAASAETYVGSARCRTLGFYRENLRLVSKITPDMVLEVRLGSTAGIELDKGVLEVSTLRFNYVFG